MKQECFECGKDGSHAHHVVPKMQGGTKTVWLCETCHGLVHEKSFAISSMVKAGIARFREENGYWGAPPRIPEETILALLAQGWSIHRIAKHFNTDSSSLYRRTKKIKKRLAK